MIYIYLKTLKIGKSSGFHCRCLNTCDMAQKKKDERKKEKEEVLDEREQRRDNNETLDGMHKPSTSRGENVGRKRSQSSGGQVYPVGEADARRQRVKEVMADVARRRAAHFATFEETNEEMGGDGDANNIHVGGQDARTLGPWSTAYQLAEAREEAKARREENILSASRGDGKDDEYEYEKWEPLKLGKKVNECHVPTLKAQSLELVSRLIEYVESLWGIPDDVRSQLAAQVCKMRRMQDDAFRLFTSNTGTWVSIPDCSSIDENMLLKCLLQGIHPNLGALILGLCGRGLTDAVARRISGETSCGGLETLVVGGAYRLTDTGCIDLLKMAPRLKTFGIPNCSRIEGDVIEKLPEISPGITSLDISWCCGIPQACLVSACENLQQLEALSLNGIVDVNDDFLASGALRGLKNLQVLSLAHCTQVSDKGLACVTSGLTKLSTIVLDHCNVSSEGVHQMAEECPHLTSVSLKRCSMVRDDAVVHLIRNCEIQKLNLNGVRHITGKVIDALVAHRSKILVEVDLSWCRNIPAKAIWYLCDSCEELEKLSLWGLNHIGEDINTYCRKYKVAVLGVGDEIDFDPSSRIK